jgi:hypothetical protein
MAKSSPLLFVLSVQNHRVKWPDFCRELPMNETAFAARVYVVIVAKPENIAGDAGS